MGIFASRSIKKDEELTFNYNVDRYGYVFYFRATGARQRLINSSTTDTMHNLVTVGNRTAWAFLAVRPKQTLVGWTISILTVRVFPLRFPQSKPFLGFPALGITDEVEQLGLKGNKKRKSKKLDEDYMVPSHALILNQVSDKQILPHSLNSSL